MKLSQFKFTLPAEQVALYPHTTERVFTTRGGETRTFRLLAVTSAG